MLVSILGTLAAIASLTIIVWGLPKQIYLNYKRKSCEGLAPDLVYSAFVIYLFWGIYGWAKPDWFIVGADIPGAILSGILVWQLYYYRKKRGGI
jgi:hypothetical protein